MFGKKRMNDLRTEHMSLNIALHKKNTQTLLFLQLWAFNADGAEQP